MIKIFLFLVSVLSPSFGAAESFDPYQHALKYKKRLLKHHNPEVLYDMAIAHQDKDAYATLIVFHEMVLNQKAPLLHRLCAFECLLTLTETRDQAKYIKNYFLPALYQERDLEFADHLLSDICEAIGMQEPLVQRVVRFYAARVIEPNINPSPLIYLKSFQERNLEQYKKLLHKSSYTAAQKFRVATALMLDKETRYQAIYYLRCMTGAVSTDPVYRLRAAETLARETNEIIFVHRFLKNFEIGEPAKSEVEKLIREIEGN